MVEYLSFDQYLIYLQPYWYVSDLQKKKWIEVCSMLTSTIVHFHSSLCIFILTNPNHCIVIHLV